MKHFARIQTEFVLKAKIQNDIGKAKESTKRAIFLGGTVKDEDGKVDDNDWRTEVKQEFKDKFTFIDPFDKNWTPEKSIYDECQGMMVADEIVFYRGGKFTEKEKDFLEGLNKKYSEFEDLDKLKEYLRGQNV